MSSCVTVTDKFITWRYWIPVVFLLKDFTAEACMASICILHLTSKIIFLRHSPAGKGELVARLGNQQDGIQGMSVTKSWHISVPATSTIRDGDTPAAPSLPSRYWADSGQGPRGSSLLVMNTTGWKKAAGNGSSLESIQLLAQLITSLVKGRMG